MGHILTTAIQVAMKYVGTLQERRETVIKPDHVNLEVEINEFNPLDLINWSEFYMRAVMMSHCGSACVYGCLWLVGERFIIRGFDDDC